MKKNLKIKILDLMNTFSHLNKLGKNKGETCQIATLVVTKVICHVSNINAVNYLSSEV